MIIADTGANTPDILGYSGINKDQNITQFKMGEINILV